MNLGFRYDVEIGTVNTDLQNPIEPGEKRGDYNNIAPRLGFAYDLRGDGRTVVRGGWGRNFDKVLLNISSNERRSLLFQFASQTVLNPSYTNPLNGITFEQIKSQNLPRNITVIANDYKTPTADQLSIGIAQQIGAQAIGADGLRSQRRLQRAARAQHQLLRGPGDAPADPSERPGPARTRSTTRSRDTKPPRPRTTTAGSSGSPAGRSDRSGADGSVGQLHAVVDVRRSREQPLRRCHQSVQPCRRVVVLGERSAPPPGHQHDDAVPVGLQFATIFFAGSKRPINTRTTLDPFGSGHGPLARCDRSPWSPATASARQKNDYKLDLRLSKTFAVGRPPAPAGHHRGVQRPQHRRT